MLNKKICLFRKITKGFPFIWGYIGYSAKFSRIRLFFDVGIGYAWNSLYPDPEDDLPLLLRGGYNKHLTTYPGAVSIDVNFGIGFAF